MLDYLEIYFCGDSLEAEDRERRGRKIRLRGREAATGLYAALVARSVVSLEQKEGQSM